MSGKTVDNIYFIGIFMKLVNNIDMKADSGSKYAMSNISSKFTFEFRESFQKFICKSLNFSFQCISI